MYESVGVHNQRCKQSSSLTKRDKVFLGEFEEHIMNEFLSKI